jgi:rhodanese-related sulfurtransferase
MPKSAMDLIAEANDAIETIDVDEARKIHANADVLFIDLREPTEIERTGTIPGAVATPRGMLEFAIDPSMPTHNEAFSSGKLLVFYCASGGRSALGAQTAQEMGLENVCHMGGGFRAWIEAGAESEGGNR